MDDTLIKCSGYFYDVEDAVANKILEYTNKYTFEELKGLEDEDNPLDRINNIHALLKLFLDSHSGFLREDIQGYLDLFAFIMNPPFNKLRKVELFLEMAIKHKAQLRYRAFYKRKSVRSDDKQP